MLIIRIILVLSVAYFVTAKAQLNKNKDNGNKNDTAIFWDDEKAIMVKINSRSSYLCDGTIISPKWIITAANCLFTDKNKPVNFNGVLIETQDKSYKVTKRNVHVNYLSKICDISTLRVQGKIKFGKKVKKVELEKTLESSDLDYKNCKVLSLKLKNSVDMHPIINDDCKQEWLGYATHRNICLKSATKKPIACTAYVGAPLICSGKQVGIFSFGPQRCESGIDVFTKIPEFTKWISENTKGKG